jgi:hypothetical protein
MQQRVQGKERSAGCNGSRNQMVILEEEIGAEAAVTCSCKMTMTASLLCWVTKNSRLVFRVAGWVTKNSSLVS